MELWLRRLPYYRLMLGIFVGDGLGEKGRRLLVGVGGPDSRMHAASFVTHRQIVLDRSLLRNHRKNRRELARILYHEVFHFVWARLGNPLRLSYEVLLRQEWAESACGELGWSAEMRKLGLARRQVRNRERPWLEYVCESFCDSAAWFCLPGPGRHREWTLKPRFRERRRRWFLAADVLPRLRME